MATVAARSASGAHLATLRNAHRCMYASGSDARSACLASEARGDSGARALPFDAMVRPQTIVALSVPARSSTAEAKTVRAPCPPLGQVGHFAAARLREACAACGTAAFLCLPRGRRHHGTKFDAASALAQRSWCRSPATTTLPSASRASFRTASPRAARPAPCSGLLFLCMSYCSGLPGYSKYKLLTALSEQLPLLGNRSFRRSVAVIVPVSSYAWL